MYLFTFVRLCSGCGLGGVLGRNWLSVTMWALGLVPEMLKSQWELCLLMLAPPSPPCDWSLV